MSFKPGERIRIPVAITAGAFLSEKFISLETVDEPISGFVNNDDLLDASGGSGYIAGLILEVKERSLLVRIKGSFFTTAGLAEVPMGEKISAVI